MSTGQVPVPIRATGPWDAAALLGLKRRLDSETSFMMFEPGERDSSVQDLARELDSAARSVRDGARAAPGPRRHVAFCKP